MSNKKNVSELGIRDIFKTTTNQNYVFITLVSLIMPNTINKTYF
tara:strand:- start:393 stop:524 length:132 start_codon:yes stop_codon:yes gene_type:complete